jgi:hypothetical protein
MRATVAMVAEMCPGRPSDATLKLEALSQRGKYDANRHTTRPNTVL